MGLGASGESATATRSRAAAKPCIFGVELGLSTLEVSRGVEGLVEARSLSTLKLDTVDRRRSEKAPPMPLMASLAVPSDSGSPARLGGPSVNWWKESSLVDWEGVGEPPKVGVDGRGTVFSSIDWTGMSRSAASEPSVDVEGVKAPAEDVDAVVPLWEPADL